MTAVPGSNEGLASNASKAMTSGRWLVTTLGVLGLLMLAQLVVAWRMDPFGVLRDPRGRSLLASEDERRAKYLLSRKYVPANFDALIIGSSASMSWRPDELSGFRFYNESVEGANASEERKIVEQALVDGRFKVALMVVNPLITSFHELGDGLDQVSRNEALGSISSFTLEYEMWRDGRGPVARLRFPDGRRIKDIHTQPKPTDVFARYTTVQDPVAIGDYRGLVEDLQAHHIRVIYVTYPLYMPFHQVNEDLLVDYAKSIEGLTPGIPLLDFNDPEYGWFRADATNYVDRIHLSASGSEKLTAMINDQMHQILGY